MVIRKLSQVSVYIHIFIKGLKVPFCKVNSIFSLVEILKVAKKDLYCNSFSILIGIEYLSLSYIFLKQKKIAFKQYYFRLSDITVGITMMCRFFYGPKLVLLFPYTLNFAAGPAGDWCWATRPRQWLNRSV